MKSNDKITWRGKKRVVRFGYAIGSLGLCLMMFCLSPLSQAQDQSESSGRKILARAVPAYPPLAQKMGIGGAVKLQVLVSPNGSMKSAEILGGHPLLVQASIATLSRFKWDAATHETKEIVIFNFHPQ